ADGIEIITDSAVTLTRVTANDNGDDGIEIDGFDAGVDDLAGPVSGSVVQTLRNGENGVDVELASSLVLDQVVSNDNGPTDTDFGIGLGVLDVAGPVTVTSSEFRRNSGPAGGGILISRVIGDVTLTDVDVTENVADLDGGGIVLALVEGTATLTRAVVDGNQATDPDDAVGGGIYATLSETTLLIVDSTISDNTSAADGGGLIVEAFDPVSSVSITRSTISGNSATDFDGGMATFGAPLTIENSTITGNTASQAASGLGVAFTTAEVSHSTITGNIATGTAATIVTAAATVTLDHTVVSGNTGDEYEEIVITTPQDPSTTTADHSYLSSDAAVAFIGTDNVTGTAPGLEALADNGGETETMRPAPTSPLVGAGDAGITGAPDTDQRGADRIVGTIDIGAVEIDPGRLDISPTATTVAETDGAVTLMIERSGGSEGAVSALVQTAVGTAGADDFTAVSETLTWADDEAGSKTITVSIATDDEVEGDESFTVSIGAPTGAVTIGDATATVTITDATAPTTTTPTTTTVPPTTLPATSGPPVIAPIADRSLAPGAVDVVTVIVSEPDGDPVTLTAVSTDLTLVGEIVITEITGGADGLAVPIAVDRTFRLEYRSLGGAGTTTMTVTASDGSASDTETFAVLVDGALLPATGADDRTRSATLSLGVLAALIGAGLVLVSRRRASV
ncbi:MAG: choice-of-anchor Q domain-containing protein, partial [Actinomycetota bacterium]